MKNKLLFLKPESSCYGNQSLEHRAGEWLQPQQYLQTWQAENHRQPGAAPRWGVEMSTLTPPVPHWDVSPPCTAALLMHSAHELSLFFFPLPSLVHSLPRKDLRNCKCVKEKFQYSEVT